jgi:hypothetical protein
MRAPSLAATLPNTRTRAILLLALYAAVQLADGALTFSGVQQYGPVAEGNPLLHFWMVRSGVGPTLLMAKGIAVALGAGLYVRQQHLVLAILTLVYVFLAVYPWASISAF